MSAQLADAIALWRRGRHDEATRACTALLTSPDEAAGARGLLAEIYSACGQFNAASEQLQRLVEAQPHDAAAWRRLGDAQFAAEDFTASAQSYRRAIEIEPNHPRGHNNYGRALARQSKPESALAAYRCAVALDPNYAIAYNNLGVALAESGDTEAAVEAYQRAIALNPKFAEAIGNQANALLRLKRHEEAFACFETVLSLAPGNTTVLCNYGHALLQLERFEQSMSCYDRALRLVPELPSAWRGRGEVLKVLRRFDEALACYERAVGLRPDDLDLLICRAGVLLDMERYGEATAHCDEMLRLRPDYPQALALRGLSLTARGAAFHAEAIANLTRLHEVAPKAHSALGSLIHTQSMLFDWSRGDLTAEALEAIRADEAVITPLATMAITDDAELQLRCARCNVPASPADAAEPLRRDRHPRNQKIRIAYLSADFRDHPMSYLMTGVFEQHDRERFEVLAVSFREPVGNERGRRILNSFDLFIDILNQTDRQAAQLLRDTRVDIAIDMMGITRGHRFPIFAHRPAPIQINYLGYPGTSGASFIDYIVADEFVIPAASRDFYSEKVVYLPECYQANDDRRAPPGEPPRRADVGLPDDAFVFCSFNNPYKITAEIFDIWCRLLKARPGSVLWMFAESEQAQRNLRDNAAQRGVDPGRIVIAPRTGYENYVTRLQLADLFLDSLPFNGGTTASDALWAGVPVLTCSGRAFAARMAGSLLRTLGLPELMTSNLGDYERRALELAAAPGCLHDLRARLAARRNTSPLYDTRRFCRHLEQAYLTMHERHQRGEPPAHFAVPALDGAVASVV